MRWWAMTVGVSGGHYIAAMSRFRLLPTPAQRIVLLEHCRHARFMWNLAVEQQQLWQPGRHAPGYNEQSAQLTEARAEYDWLADGSQTVQQQALRDFAQAMRNFFAGTHGRPSWRKAGVHEGFRQVGLKPRHVEKLNRRYGRAWVPKIGWVRFRWTRGVPADVKSYRITRDRGGRWHVAFAHIPDPIPGPGDGSVAGVDRGVAISAALSTGELLHAPSLDLVSRFGCAGCNGASCAQRAAPTADNVPSWRSRKSRRAKQTDDATGSKKRPPTLRAGSTQSGWKTSMWGR
jgi:transposase